MNWCKLLKNASIYGTPLKINMEPEHHLICKGKSSQPNLHDILQVPAVHFRLVYGKVAHYFGVLEVDVGFNKQQPTSNQLATNNNNNNNDSDSTTIAIYRNYNCNSIPTVCSVGVNDFAPRAKAVIRIFCILVFGLNSYERGTIGKMNVHR